MDRALFAQAIEVLLLMGLALVLSLAALAVGKTKVWVAAWLIGFAFADAIITVLLWSGYAGTLLQLK